MNAKSVKKCKLNKEININTLIINTLYYYIGLHFGLHLVYTWFTLMHLVNFSSLH